MKTKLVINDDLKKYLQEEINRSTKEDRDICKRINKDDFNYQWIFKFDNKFGASVIKFWGSYGFDNDLFEMATIHFTDTGYSLTDLKGIDDNPIGYLTNYEVMEYLYQIKKSIEKEGDKKDEN